MPRRDRRYTLYEAARYLSAASRSAPHAAAVSAATIEGARRQNQSGMDVDNQDAAQSVDGYGELTQYSYEVGPRKQFGVDPLNRAYLWRTDIQKVSYGQGSQRSVGGITFEPFGWEGSNENKQLSYSFSGGSNQTQYVRYPMHVHTLGVFCNPNDNSNTLKYVQGRWQQPLNNPELNWKAAGSTAKWANTNYDNARFFIGEAFDGRANGLPTKKSDGWIMMWNSEKYDSENAVYGDARADGQQADSGNSVSKNFDTRKTSQVHMSSTVNLVLYGVADRYARYKVKIYKCSTSDAWPGRCPSWSNDMDFDTTVAAGAANSAFLQKNSENGYLQIPYYDAEVYEYVTSVGRNHPPSPFYKKGVKMTTVFEEEFVLSARNSVTSGVERRHVRIHLQQSDVKDYDAADMLQGFSPGYELEAGSNGRSTAAITDVRVYTPSTFARPDEQLFLMVCADERTGDGTKRQYKNQAGTDVSGVGEGNYLNPYAVRHSYDIDVYERFMAVGAEN